MLKITKDVFLTTTIKQEINNVFLTTIIKQEINNKNVTRKHAGTWKPTTLKELTYQRRKSL